MYTDRKKRIKFLSMVFVVAFFFIAFGAILTLMKRGYLNQAGSAEMIEYQIILALMSLFTGVAFTYIFVRYRKRSKAESDDIAQIIREKDMLNDAQVFLEEFADLYVITTDSNFSVTDTNEKAELLFSAIASEFRNSLRSLISADEVSDEDIMAVLSGDKAMVPVTLEPKPLREDEVILSGIMSPVRDIDGEIYMAQLILKDSTCELKREARLLESQDELLKVREESRMKIEEALKASESLRHSIRILSDTFIAAPTGLVIIDNNGIITNCNRASENLFGYHEKDVIGKHIAELYTNRNVTNELLLKAEAGQNVECEADCLRSDLSHFVGMLKVKPVFDDKHNVIRYVVSINDITKRTKLEKYLLLKNQELISINDIFMSANQFIGLEQKLNVFLDKLFDNFEVVRKGLLYLCTGDELLELYIYKGFNFTMLKELRTIDLNSSLCGKAIKTDSVILSSLFDAEDGSKFKDMLEENGVDGSKIYLPISYKEEPLGVLIIFPNKSYHFNNDDLEFFSMLRSELGTCIKQSLKYEELKKRIILLSGDDDDPFFKE